MIAGLVFLPLVQTGNYQSVTSMVSSVLLFSLPVQKAWILLSNHDFSDSNRSLVSKLQVGAGADSSSFRQLVHPCQVDP